MVNIGDIAGDGGMHIAARGIDLRRLRYFVAVSDELHFGRAAERLHIAQPAISRQIAQLEAGIGALLFDRTRNNIRLTPAGKTLLEHARRILVDVAEAARLARRAAEGMTGVLEVGFVGSATYSVLPRILKRFRSAYPQIELVLHAMNTAELRDALVSRRIDVAFARPGIDDPEVIDEPLLDEPLIVALPEDHPCAALAEVSLPMLAKSSFVLYPRNPRPSFADTILHLCADAGFAPKVAQETMELQTALGLIAVGAGVSLVPASVEQSQRHGVAYRPIAGQAPRTKLSLSMRRDNRAVALRHFRQEVRAAIRHGF